MSTITSSTFGPSLLAYGNDLLMQSGNPIALRNQILNFAKSNAMMCKNPHFNATIAAQYLEQFATEYGAQSAVGIPVSYIVGGIVLTGAVAYGAYKAYKAYNELKTVVSAPLVKADVEVKLALQVYNNGGIKNNLKSRVAFAKVALSATGHAIANIIKTIFFAITGINKNRRDSMRINARAAVVEIKLATHATLGVVAPSLAQRIQNRA